MNTRELVIPITITSYDELDASERQLVDEARKMTYNSYAPYSKFSVGAAILLSNGEIVTGANQENAAYPSGTCAERSAAFYAHARYPQANFKAIAIAARGTSGNYTVNPISPCGACRQALLEYETIAGENVKVILVGEDAIYVLPSIKSLLPLAFSEFE